MLAGDSTNFCRVVKSAFSSWVTSVTGVSAATTSLTYEFEVCRGETPAARGRLGCVQSDPDGGGGQPWPQDVAAILRGEAPTHGGL